MQPVYTPLHADCRHSAQSIAALAISRIYKPTHAVLVVENVEWAQPMTAAASEMALSTAGTHPALRECTQLPAADTKPPYVGTNS